MIEWIVLGVIIFFIIIFVWAYNRVLTLKNRVKNAWAQIDVLLKKRHDLVPNLLNAVKGYMAYEQRVLKDVTRLRTEALKARSVRERAKIEEGLTGALKTLFAVAENYPELKANDNFKILQEELIGIENKIAYARQFYNEAVYEYNVALDVFPTNLLGKMLKLKKAEYFEVPEGEKKVVEVSF